MEHVYELKVPKEVVAQVLAGEKLDAAKLAKLPEVASVRSLDSFVPDEQPAKLKLMAFASERAQYQPGDLLFHQGDTADAAFIILGNLIADLVTPLVDPRIRLR